MNFGKIWSLFLYLQQKFIMPGRLECKNMHNEPQIQAFSHASAIPRTCHDKFPPQKTPNPSKSSASRLTVGLLEAGTGTGTTELLGLGASVIGDEEGSVVLHEGLLELVLGVLVDVFLVVGDYRLGDGLSDGVDLGGVTTTVDTDADVDFGELVEAEEENGLVDL